MGGFDALLDAVSDALGSLRTPDVHNTALLFLAGVLMWSGSAKLRRPTLAALALVDFGLVRSAKPTLGLALAWSEICVGGSLVFAVVEGGPFATWSTCVALLLFASFVVLIGRALARGDRFACFCFGDASTSLSRFTLIRAGGLTALALALVVVQPGDDLASPTGRTLLLEAVVAAGLIASFLHASLATRLLLARRRLVRGEGGTS